MLSFLSTTTQSPYAFEWRSKFGNLCFFSSFSRCVKASEEESWRLIDGIVVVNQRNDNNKRYTKSMENGDRGRKDRRENDTLLDGI